MNTTLLLQSRYETGRARVTAMGAGRVMEIGIGLRIAERLSTPQRSPGVYRRALSSIKLKGATEKDELKCVV